MNIFVIENCPVKSAQSQCDKHVVKMSLETAQIICTVLENYKPPYKATHRNHPCTLWAGKTKENFEWTVKHFEALLNEYTFRYGKIHKCETKVFYWLKGKRIKLPGGGLTPFVQAMPDKYKDRDAVLAYRRYYISDKAGFAKWSKRKKPEWFC